MAVFSPGKTISQALTTPKLPVVLCLGLRPPGIFPIHVSMSIGVFLFQVMFRQHVGERLPDRLLTFLRETASQQTLHSSGSYGLSTHFLEMRFI